MSLLTGVVSLLTLVVSAHGLQPLSPNQVLNAPLSSPSLGLIRLNLSSTDNGIQLINAANSNAVCDGKRYGRYLDKTSCEDVWRKIPTNSDSFTFGARTQGDFERPLPLRYLSNDGRCAIEINHNFRRDQDTTTNKYISMAARWILDDCVFRDERTKTMDSVGGYVSHVGTNSGLNIKMFSYSADVRCDPGVEFWDQSMCLKLLNTMFVSASRYAFTRDSSVTDKRVFVPPGGKKLLGSGECYGTINFQQGDTAVTDLSSWYEMWAAAVAVNDMCIRYGLAGTAYGLGRDKTLTLSLGRL